MTMGKSCNCKRSCDAVGNEAAFESTVRTTSSHAMQQTSRSRPTQTHDDVVAMVTLTFQQQRRNVSFSKSCLLLVCMSLFGCSSNAWCYGFGIQQHRSVSRTNTPSRICRLQNSQQSAPFHLSTSCSSSTSLQSSFLGIDIPSFPSTLASSSVDLVDGSSSSVLLSQIVDTITTTYGSELSNHPLQTQILTGIVLAVIGDAIVQKQQSTSGNDDDVPTKYDSKRAISFAAFDGVYRSVQHFVYPPMIAACQGTVLGGVFEKMFSLFAQNPDAITASVTPLAAAIEQALVSQLVIIPLVYYPSFYIMTGLVQGLSVNETIDRAKTTFWSLMIRNWLYWIPVQAGVFAFVQDESLQISLFIAFGLVWTIILSAVAGKATSDASEEAFDPPEKIMMEQEAEQKRGLLLSYDSTETTEGAFENDEVDDSSKKKSWASSDTNTDDDALLATKGRRGEGEK